MEIHINHSFLSLRDVDFFFCCFLVIKSVHRNAWLEMQTSGFCLFSRFLGISENMVGPEINILMSLL